MRRDATIRFVSLLRHTGTNLSLGHSKLRRSPALLIPGKELDTRLPHEAVYMAYSCAPVSVVVPHQDMGLPTGEIGQVAVGGG